MTRRTQVEHRLRLAILDYMERYPATDFSLGADPEDVGTMTALLEGALRDGRQLAAADLDGATVRGRFRVTADHYRALFGTVPDTWRINPTCLPALTAAMQAAILAGRGLTTDEASLASGVTPIPLDAVG